MAEIYYGANGFNKEKKGRPIIDLICKRFGKLVVKEFAYRSVFYLKTGKPTTVLYWLCECDCGNIKVIRGSHLKSGEIISCGCYKRNFKENIAPKIRKPSHYPTRLYKVWNQMIRRCHNPSDEAYKWYGGRGISVCNEWRESFPLFKEWAFNNGYDINARHHICTIDRIDCNGNYEPSNCRWVDMKVQNNNRRNNVANREKYGLKAEVT